MIYQLDSQYHKSMFLRIVEMSKHLYFRVMTLIVLFNLAIRNVCKFWGVLSVCTTTILLRNSQSKKKTITCIQTSL